MLAFEGLLLILFMLFLLMTDPVIELDRYTESSKGALSKDNYQFFPSKKLNGRNTRMDC